MNAWDMIYIGQRDQVSLNHLRELFPDNENYYFQERCFSRLHKVILGTNAVSLERELISGCDDINQPDSNGSTPLMWAIQKKDAISAELLLKNGADPNIHDNTGTTALHSAAFRSDFKSVRILLRYGAIATHQDNKLRNALHLAAQTCGSPEIFMILLAAGVDIEARDVWGSTALAYSAGTNNTSGITVLLDLGARIDTADPEGDTPLSNAVQRAHSNSVKLLLERGANYTTPNIFGNTILHDAARSGDTQMLKVIRDANLKIINPNSRNAKERTAFEIAQDRHSPNEFIDLFLVLLFEIRNRNDYLAGCQRPNCDVSTEGNTIGEINKDQSSSPDSDTEEFFDAHEHLSSTDFLQCPFGLN